MPFVWGSGVIENLFRILCYDGNADLFDHAGDGVVGFCEGVPQRVVAVSSGEVP